MRPDTPLYFDYLPHAHAASLSEDQINSLVGVLKPEYGTDLNLLELRLLRLFRAIEDGRISFEEALLSEAGVKAPSK